MKRGVITVSAVLLDELRDAGLLVGADPHLTDKGRDWLRQLEDLGTGEVAEEWAADFVLSVNAISR